MSMPHQMINQSLDLKEYFFSHYAQFAPVLAKTAIATFHYVGEEGRKPQQINQFGDQALLMDVSIEQSVIATAREHKLPFQVISEEHGTIELCDAPLYTLVMDGLDGSSVYKNQTPGGRYGTMIAIYEGLNPQLTDYLASIIIDHGTHTQYIAYKGHGAFQILLDQEPNPIQVSQCRELHDVERFCVDEAFNLNVTTFSEPLAHLDPIYLKSSAPYYADLSSGVCQIVGECTRKNSLEIITAYGLVIEAGGVMVDLQGRDMGHYRMSDLSVDQASFCVLTAANRSLSQQALHHIKHFINID